MVAMTIRTRKRLLLAVNVLLAAGLVWAGCAMAFGGPETRMDDSRAAATASLQPSATADNSSALAAFDQYAVIYERDLRQVLFDPPPVVAAPPPKPKIPVTLEGTAVEPGHSVAFLRTKSGRVEIGRQGQTIEGVEIIEIRDQSVTVRFNDEDITLTIDSDEGGPR